MPASLFMVTSPVIWIAAVAILLLEGSWSVSSALAGEAIATSISIEKIKFRTPSPWNPCAAPFSARSLMNSLQPIAKQEAAGSTAARSCFEAFARFPASF
jgi:hypothetical protein